MFIAEKIKTLRKKMFALVSFDFEEKNLSFVIKFISSEVHLITINKNLFL